MLNLTPHTISFCETDNLQFDVDAQVFYHPTNSPTIYKVLPSSGSVRVINAYSYGRLAADIPVKYVDKTVPPQLVGFPDNWENHLIIVSAIARNAMAEAGMNLYKVYTIGDTVREILPDKSYGRILAAISIIGN